MLSQKQLDKIKASLSSEDISNISDSFKSDGTGPYNKDMLYGTVGKAAPSYTVQNENSANKMVNFFDKTLGSVGNFIMKNIVGAPARLIGSFGADVVKGVNQISELSAAKSEGRQAKAVEGISTESPFGKMKSTENMQDVAKLGADALATISTMAGGVTHISTNVGNKALKTVFDIALNTAKDTAVGATQGAAAGYAETGNVEKAKEDAIRGAIFSGVLSLAGNTISGIAQLKQAGDVTKSQKIATATTDKQTGWYNAKNLSGSPEKYQSWLDNRGLENNIYALQGDKIDSFASWQAANKKGLDYVDDIWNKVAQSADDAGTMLETGLSKGNIMDLAEGAQYLGTDDRVLFTDLVSKLDDGSIGIADTNRLVKLLDKDDIYQNVSKSTQKLINKLKDDMVDNIANYWDAQTIEDGSKILDKDAVYNIRKTFSALTETKKMLATKQGKILQAQALERQGNTSAMEGVLDDIYNAGVGIKNPLRIALGFAKNVVKGKFTALEKVDEQVADMFKYMNDNTYTKALMSDITNIASKASKLDVEVPEGGIASDQAALYAEEAKKYAESIKSGAFKNTEVMPSAKVENIQPSAPEMPSAGQGTPIVTPQLDKTAIYKEIYSTMDSGQLQSQYNSLSKQLATLIRNQRGQENTVKIDAMKEQINVLSELLGIKK